MKFSKIFALVLAIMMILPFIASCGQEKKTVSFPNVTILNAYEEKQEETQTKEASEQAKEKKDPEEMFSGEVAVPVDDESAAITVEQVIKAFENDENEEVVIEGNKLIKIGEVSRGGGYYWDIRVNGQSAGLGTEVKAEDEIVFIFTNEKDDLKAEEANS